MNCLGDQATLTLSGLEIQNVFVGNILCDPHYPIPVSSKFEARILVFSVVIPITKGYSVSNVIRPNKTLNALHLQVILHHQSLAEQAVITKLISQLNKSSGEVEKKHPRYLRKNSNAIVEITVAKPVALELFSECKELGRVMLRVAGTTIAAGLITRIIAVN